MQIRLLAFAFAVPVGKSNTNVVMMQAAEDGPRFDAPEGVNSSPRRRILFKDRWVRLRL